MVNFPRPITKDESGLNVSEIGYSINQMPGFYADVMLIIQATGNLNAIVTDVVTNTDLCSADGFNQTIVRYFVENLDEARYNKVTVAPLPTNWSYKLFVTFHRITGTYGAR